MRAQDTDEGELSVSVRSEILLPRRLKAGVV